MRAEVVKWTPAGLKAHLDWAIRQITDYTDERPTAMGLTAQQWRVVIDQLEANYPVVSLDLLDGLVWYERVQLHRQGVDIQTKIAVKRPGRAARRW